MKHFILIATLFLCTAWVDTGAYVYLDGVAADATPPVPAGLPALVSQSDDLTGTWELVEQRGYGPGHPDDVEQTLTFQDDGRMINRQSTGGQSTVMVLMYRVEGNQIIATVESVELNGEALDMDGVMPEQTFQWQIENGQLIVSDEQRETQDIYRRAG